VQQEIILWRKGDKTRKPFQASLQQQYRQMQNPNAQLSNSDQSISGGKAGSASQPTTSGESIDENADGEPVTRTHHNTKSPLEDDINSEQPTPDKEFQSVLNSDGKGDTQVESPVDFDNHPNAKFDKEIDENEAPNNEASPDGTGSPDSPTNT